MQEKILEIVVYLMNQLSDHQGIINNIDEMSADLRSMGFTDKEISSAYSWLLKHFEDYPKSFSMPHTKMDVASVRILSNAERNIILPEAYGYLLQLRQLRLLSAEQLELILDRCALFSSDPICIEDIKLFASAAMFETGSSEMPFAIWVGDPESEPIN
ncbi:MAG: DUF494 family protein [Candidatus Zixiibacteriota bacterium]